MLMVWLRRSFYVAKCGQCGSLACRRSAEDGFSAVLYCYNHAHCSALGGQIAVNKALSRLAIERFVQPRNNSGQYVRIYTAILVICLVACTRPYQICWS